MELRQLRYFVAVAEKASFTRAAERVHVTQPGLSAQIAALERELGQALFRRGRHGAKLTEVGESVLGDAREALAAAERMRSRIDEYRGLLRGRVRIGFISGAIGEEFDISPVLARFRAEHPLVKVTLSEHDSDTMVGELARGELDLAIIGITGDPLPHGIETHVVVDVPIVAVLPDEDERFTSGRVELERLVQEPLVCLTRGTGIRGMFEHACREHGLRPDVSYEAAAPPVLLDLAAHGLGVAVVPELTRAEASAYGVRAVSIVDPELRGQLALAWTDPRQQTSATKLMLDRLRAAVRGRLVDADDADQRS